MPTLEAKPAPPVRDPFATIPLFRSWSRSRPLEEVSEREVPIPLGECPVPQSVSLVHRSTRRLSQVSS